MVFEESEYAQEAHFAYACLVNKSRRFLKGPEQWKDQGEHSTLSQLCSTTAVEISPGFWQLA